MVRFETEYKVRRGLRSWFTMMKSGERARLSHLNPHLICVLCGGYLIDATTIVRCLHTFCRTCIIHFLQTNNRCPVCTVTVHKKAPYSELRPDKTLQDIVYKVVPGLFKDEMSRRRECYRKNDSGSDKREGHQPMEETHHHPGHKERIIVSPDEKISISLEFCPNGVLSDGFEDTVDEAVIENRYLLCPAAVSVCNLKKFLRMKFSLSDTYAIDMYYEDEVLRDSYSLVDVAYISSWTGSEVLKILYSIYENPSKKIKRTKSLECVRCSNDDSGIEDGNQSFESSPSTDTSLLNDSGQGLDSDVTKCDTNVLKAADSSSSCDTNTLINGIKENSGVSAEGHEAMCVLVNGNVQGDCIVAEADALEAVAPMAEALFKDEDDDVVIEKLDETVNRIIAEGDNNEREQSVKDVNGSISSVQCETRPQKIQRQFSNAATETERQVERRFSNASTETDNISQRRFSNASTETDNPVCDLSLPKPADKSLDMSPSNSNHVAMATVEHTQAQTQTQDSKPTVSQSTDFCMQTNITASEKQCSDKGVQHSACDSNGPIKNNLGNHSNKSSTSGHVHDGQSHCAGVCNGHSVKSRGPEKLVVKLSKEKDSESYTATIT